MRDHSFLRERTERGWGAVSAPRKSPLGRGNPAPTNGVTNAHIGFFAYTLSIFSGLSLLAASVAAQPVNPNALFVWELSPTSAQATPGDTIHLVARLTIAPEHYVYGERTSVALTGVPDEVRERLVVGEPIRSEPDYSYDTFEGREVAKYHDEAAFRLPVVLQSVPPVSEFTLTVTLRTQGCAKTMCYFPMREERAVAVRVSAPERGAPSTGIALTDYSSPESSFAGAGGVGGLGGMLAERGLLIALGIMFLGGILTSFTPCVYPLIPITVSVFGASTRGASTLRGLSLSVVFVLGMAVMYSVLGVSAAATGAVFGSVMSNPFVIGFIASLFVVFAASMFGAFTIRLPQSWQLRLKRIGGLGFGGAFAMGLVAGVIAAPCTGPVLGTALAYVATTGDLSFGLVAMFSFALGMGLLFILIGTFSRRVVPESGEWLENVESIFGVLMLVAALYFLKDVIAPLKAVMSGATTALLASLGIIAVGLFVGAVHLRFVAGYDKQGNKKPDPSLGERLRKGFGIVLAVGGAYGVVGYFVAPPAIGLEALPQLAWVTSEQEGLLLARREQRPVLIDAYADWCIACNELDRSTYSDERVRARLEDFVAIKLDFTEPTTPENTALQRKYSIVGLPTVIILDPTGKELSDRRLLGYEPPEAFLTRLAGVR